VIETWLEAALTVNNHLLWGAGSSGDETKKIENKDTGALSATAIKRKEETGEINQDYQERGNQGENPVRRGQVRPDMIEIVREARISQNSTSFPPAGDRTTNASFSESVILGDFPPAKTQTQQEYIGR
jgi:hypothetical protein